jgi:hypothetical protein
MGSSSEIVVTNSALAKCPILTGKDNYSEWAEIMQSNLITSGCWDIVNGDEETLPRPDPFYTSRNRPTGVVSLRQAEPEYNRRTRGNYIYNEESCKDRVLEIKDQVAGYEAHIRLKEKAKNLMMDRMTKDLWHQRVNKEDPRALWDELRRDYQKAGVPELGKELAKFMDITKSNYPEPQALLDALKTQHSKIEVTLKGSVFHPKYLSWRYIYEMNKFKPLFDIPLAQYDNLNEYPPADDIKRALEAYLVNHPDVPKKPTASANNTVADNNTGGGKKRKRDKDKDNKSNKSTNQSSSQSTGQSSQSNSQNASTERNPVCSICGYGHGNKCWFKSPDEVPQWLKDRLVSRNKNRQDKKDNKGKTGQ